MPKENTKISLFDPPLTILEFVLPGMVCGVLKERRMNMKKSMCDFLKEEDGAALAEYGILVGLVALVVIVGATGLGTTLKTLFTTISSKLPTP